jgi:hypothetical protein
VRCTTPGDRGGPHLADKLLRCAVAALSWGSRFCTFAIVLLLVAPGEVGHEAVERGFRSSRLGYSSSGWVSFMHSASGKPSAIRSPELAGTEETHLLR